VTSVEHKWLGQTTQ